VLELNHQFQVPLGVDDAWGLLTDLPTVARCLPGAHLDASDGGEFRGGLAAKIGPITARYRGAASFRERDEVAHRAVVEARGQEEKGSGSASALITMVLKPDGAATVVDVTTEMNISGRAAQFGRSLLAEVSNSLMGQFAENLAEMIRSGTTGSEAGRGATTPPEATASAAPAATPVGTTAGATTGELDVVRTLVVPALKRALVPASAGLAGLALGLLVGARRRGRGGAGIPLTYVLPYPGTRLADPGRDASW